MCVCVEEIQCVLGVCSTVGRARSRTCPPLPHLEDAVLYVELGHAVLVQQRRQHGERRARLCHDRDRDCGAHAVLALLDLEVVEQRNEDVLGGVSCIYTEGLCVSNV